MTVKEIFNIEEKTAICSGILQALPDWFANEESVKDYAKQVCGQMFFAAYVDTAPVGFLSLKQHNPFTAEVYVMGVLSENHRSGAGTALMQAAEERCRAFGVRFLTVKTLDASADYAPYEATRRFYTKAGFLPLEVFTTLWDEENPCLFMAKYLWDDRD